MLIKNKHGEIVDDSDPAILEESKRWKVQDIIKAQRLLNVKYAHMEPTLENIQGLIDELKKEFGEDEEQTTLAIESHFKNKKG